MSEAPGSLAETRGPIVVTGALGFVASRLIPRLLERGAQVAALVMAAGLRLANADCTVICEIPRIGGAREIMMERLSAAAAGPVHVKATRPEGLGSLGRVEGIACLATALLEEIGL